MANVTGIKKRKEDIGDHLMALFESNRERENEENLKQEVAQLQTQADSLKLRRDNLRKDIIRNVNSNKNDSTGILTPIKVRYINLLSEMK